MCPWAHRPVRGGVVLVVAALVAAACGSGGDPTLADGREPSEPAIALELLAENDAADAVPTPQPPSLLGLDGPALPPERHQRILAFDEAFTPPIAQAAQTDLPGGARPTAVADVAPDPDPPEEEGIDTTAEPGADEPAAFPDPPPAASAVAPLYPDPSATFVGASGRPMELFPAGDLDRTDRGVTAGVIKVGGLATQSLVGNPYRVDVCTGARARFEQANHHRELRRRIELTECHDDAGQTDLSSGVTGALLRDEVFAVVPLASPAFAAEDRLNRERMLYVGDERLPAFCGRATLLGFGTRGARGCPVLEARGYVTLVEPVLTAYLATRPEGASHPSLTYVVTDDAEGQGVAASRAFEAELLETPSPTFLAILPSAADATPTDWRHVVGEIVATEPDVVVLDGPRTEGLPSALRQDGFGGEVVLVGTVDPLTVADPSRRAELAPLTVVTPGLDLANRATPGWRAVLGAAAAVGLAPAEVGLDFVRGYLAADFFVQAVAATGTPLTTERFANTVNGGWWYPGVDGVACGSWWPAAHLVPTPCVSIARVDVFSDRLVPVLDLVEVEPQLRFELNR